MPGRSDTQTVGILFLTANPSDTTRIAVGEEFHEIDARVRAARCRDRFEITYVHEVRADELAGVLQRYTPTIVHFSGHGSVEGELLLPDVAGRATAVKPETVAELFGILSRDIKIRCVVLNACYSDALAKAIAAHVECVIGMPVAVKDKAAVAFAGAFYEGLGFGRDVDAAYRLACNRVNLALPARAELPRLHTRSDVDAMNVRFVKPSQPDDDAATEIDPAFARLLPEAGEVAELIRLVTQSGASANACRGACLAADAGATALTTVDEMAWRLARFTTAVPVPKLVVFAHHVALAALASRDELLAWAAGHAERHERDVAAINAHWSALEERRLGRHCLMVVLDEDDVGRFHMKAWLGREHAGATPVRARDGAITLDEVASAVDDLLQEEPVYTLLLDTGAHLLIELIVPLQGMLGPAGRSSSAGCASDHDVVLRWRERVYERVKRPPRGVRPGLWQRKWQRARLDAASWAPPSEVTACEVAELAFSREECVALALPLQPAAMPRAQRIAIIERALQHGLPVVAWLTDDATENEIAAAFEALTKGAPSEALDRVTSARRRCAPPTSGRHLALVWDDPERLPPDARKAAQFAAPKPA